MGKRAINAEAARRRAATQKIPQGSRRRAAGGTKARETREDIFVRHYIATQNRSYSAVQAGYTNADAYSAGSKLLAVERVRRRIDDALAEKLAAADFSAQEVVNDLRDALRFDRRELYGEDGKLLPVRKMSAQAARMVEGVEIDYVRGRGTVAKVKVEKHIATRDQAMRLFGLFKQEEAAKDPDEAARMVRERLGDIEALTAPRKKP